jgi:dCMP deaminase
MVDDVSSKWDARFLGAARLFAGWSKDPSTKVACVLVSPDRSLIIPGYNGFPRGIEDTEERLNNRAIRIEIVLHAEENALLVAQRSLHSFTAYTWPVPPCSRCAAKLIQVGIRRVVTVAPSEDFLSRWADSIALAKELYAEAGVEYIEAEFP